MSLHGNWRKGRVGCLLIGSAWSLMAAAAHAATFDVNSTLDAPESPAAFDAGICDDGEGHCTLRAAIQLANAAASPSTINVPAGNYVLSVVGVDEAPAGGNGGFSVAHTADASKGDLNIIQSVNIVGAGSARTVIGWAPGAQADRVFHIEVPPTATADLYVGISGVTIQNGFVPAPAVLDATVPTAVVKFARMGGGIAIGAGAELQTINSTVTEGAEGTEGEGGGMGAGGSHAGPEGHGGPGESESGASIGLVTLSDVHVIDNHAGAEGGGIYNTGPIAIDHAVITGNSSDVLGGGLFETGFHTSLIERSAFIGNTASGGSGGGGIAGRRMVIQIISRSTIAANTAASGGAGIQTNGRVILTNSTVADNTIARASGAVGAGLNGFGPASAQGAGGSANASNFTMTNTIIAHNTVAGATPTVANCGGKGEGDPKARFFSMGHNLEDADSCGLAAAGDKTGVDPMLGPLADNGGPTPTMALMSGSPAVDAGDDAACPNNDQRGQIGRADSNLDGQFQCDIGAYELFVHTADLHIENVTTPDTVFVGDPFDLSVAIHVDPNATTASSGVRMVTSALSGDVVLSSAQVTTPAGTQGCALSAGAVACDAGTLAPGALALMTLRLVAAVENPDLLVTTTASQSSPVDPDPSNNSAQARLGLIGKANLRIRSQGPSAPVIKGARSSMTFSVENAGPATATGVRVGFILPDNVTYSSIDLPGATCVYDGTDEPRNVECTIDSMAPDDSLSGTLVVTATTVGDGATTFAVDSPQHDVVLADNQAVTTLSVEPVPVVPPPQPAASDTGGGCTVGARGGADPSLVGILVVGLLGLYRAAARRHVRR